MAALVVHLFVWASVCGFLTGVWTLTNGSAEKLSDIAGDPSLAMSLGFWPIWVFLVAGAALLIHAGVVIASALFGRRARRRRARIAKALLARRPRERDPYRRWVTVLFADIVGSTTAAESLGDEEWTRRLTRFRAVVRTAVRDHRGHEVGTQGDGFLARFDAADDAVDCALAVNDGVAGLDAGLELRVGLHAGEAMHSGSDVIGHVINVAARVMGCAEPGEVLVTEQVADHLRGRLALEDRGLHVLKGVSQPRHLLAIRLAD